MTTDTEKIQIAHTILNQLGGPGRLKSFIGINKHCARDAGMQFSFKGNAKMNKCVIDLNDTDLYDMKFYKIPTLRTDCSPAALTKYIEDMDKCNVPVAEISGLYSDMLVDAFEQTTDLFLHF